MLAVLWLAWLFLVASDTFASLVSTAWKFFASFNISTIWSRPTARLVGVSDRLFLGQTLKNLYSAIYFSACISGGLFWLFGRSRKESNHALEAMYWAIGCFVLGLITAFLQQAEFIERVLLYAFIPLSVVAVLNYKNKYGKAFLVSMIIVGVFLSVFAAYTNECFEYAPSVESQGAIFMAHHNIIDLNNVAALDPISYVIEFHILRGYLQSGTNPTDFSPRNGTILVWSKSSEAYYSVFFEGRPYGGRFSEVQWMENYLNLTLFVPGYNLIYTNEYFEMAYVNEKLNVTGHYTINLGLP